MLKELTPYLWPQHKPKLKLLIILTLISIVLSKVFSITVPFIFKWSVDALSVPAKPFNMFLLLVLSYGIARILSQGFNDLRDVLFSRVMYTASREIALQVFKHLHKLSLAFHLNRKTGSLSRDIDRGIKAVETILMFTVFNIIPTLLEVLLALGVLLYFYSASFSLIIFGTIAIYTIFTLYITKWRLKILRAKNAADSDANGKAIDSLLNYETVKYFSRDEHEIKRYDESLSNFIENSVHLRQSLGLLNFGQGVIISVGLMLLMYLSGQYIHANQMSVGDYVLLNTFLLQLYMPLFVLGYAYREIREALINLEQLFELKNQKIDVQENHNALQLEVSKGEVSFKNIAFAYSKDRQILKDISFNIPAGKTVALVGPSGSGKSTLARLLFRFYDPTSGSIAIDSQDICKADLNSLRENIGVVSQDAVLFNDTLGYNLSYALEKYEEKKVKRVATRAHLDGLIKTLPDGLDTLVGERGLKLSGGEKQRVCIARALLKNPKIFIFDEATSALDTHTEKAIQKDLETISKGVTTLLIAHRLSTVVNAHNIIVLKEGQIVEQGSHKELLKKKGEYYDLWQKQEEN